MLEFECPHCKAILNIPEQFVGEKGTCKKCGKPIVIEASSAHDPSVDTGAGPARRPPTLVAFHCESTGPSSRKCNITELAGFKFTLMGKEVDSFATFANPGHLIPPRISEKTGITDEMVEHSPPSSEVAKMWFDWVGPQAILFSHHAHFNTKFVCATLLKENVDPPRLKVVDALGWARELDVPVTEYKLRALLDFIGYPVKRAHRALETCQGVAALVNYLIKRQVGAHVESDQEGVLGKLLGKRVETVHEATAFTALKGISSPMEEMCGEGFYDKTRYDKRGLRARTAPLPSALPPDVEQALQEVTPRRRPEWFDERKGDIERSRQEYLEEKAAGRSVLEQAAEDAPWDYILLEASQCEDPEEQKKLCLQALSLGALEPWPYEKLTALYIKAKDYKTARDLCEKYFDGEGWKAGKWAETGLRLLRRLEKLERRLARKS